jgi:chromosome segregation protein
VRLTQINLAGFKSFVDPTHIPVPGKLVGIVGPNGCGKSNIIDAVRWVLGETSARHLRGETMQDVLFNGSGDRKPVNRCSVELIFDNSLGKAAGQWSRYSEIAIKRVLERDGDSSYYINNIHVRRRDIADIFLGTGLGARAYAIIEQGMISRVIEAKPEELRVFLEEAAGVSKYRERRRETESRLQDTRENLMRVDDIRQELAKQLEHLQVQADVARQYHALQTELSGTQHMLWLTKKNEAVASRNRCNREIERVSIELEAETAKLREAEKRLEELRDGHYRAGDAVHAAQGALYEVNAEVARIEQEIAHVRDKRSRIEHQLGALSAELAGSETSLASAQQALEESRAAQEAAHERVEACEARVADESGKMPVAEEAFRTSNTRRDELQRQVAQHEQALHVEQTRLEHAARVLEQLAAREGRLREEQAALPAPDGEAVERAQAEAQEIEYALQEQRAALAEAEQTLPRLEQALREQSAAWDAATQKATGTQARVQALQQLQDRIARGAGMEDWLAARGLDRAPRLWQSISIEPGWEDALEAVLRERLNGIALERFDIPPEWLRDAPPGKMTVVDASTASAPLPQSLDGTEPLRRHVTCRNAGLEGVLEEWLHDVYVVHDAGAGMASRDRLPPGGMLVTREGHIYTRHSVSFHAADSELHGVLSRQREIEALTAELEAQRATVEEAQRAVDDAEQAIERHKAQVAELREQVAQLQQRHHGVQLEALRLSEQ